MNQNFFALVYSACGDDQKFFLDERSATYEYEANYSAELAEVRALADFFSQLANDYDHFSTSDE